MSLKSEIFVPLCATLIIILIVLVAFDQGIDMGTRKNARVLKCADFASSRSPIAFYKRYCAVEFDDSKQQASVYLPAQKVGDKIVLSVMQRPVTKTRYYVLAKTTDR